MAAPVVRVPCIFGGHYYVAAADLDGTRPLLRLYTRDGVVLSHTEAGQRRERRGEFLMIHRENIGRKQTEAESLAIVEAVFAAAEARTREVLRAALGPRGE